MLLMMESAPLADEEAAAILEDIINLNTVLLISRGRFSPGTPVSSPPSSVNGSAKKTKLK